MVNALDTKLVRDLWHMRGQAMAIALVLAAATATLVLSLGVHRSLTQTRDSYYERNRFAEVFAEMTRAPRSMLPRIAAIPGVRRVQGTIVQYATLDLPGRTDPVRALINSIDEQGRDGLNLLVLRSGRVPHEGEAGEIVVEEGFARAAGLKPGDRFGALIYGRRQQLEIVGIGLAPNYIWAIAPGDLMPDQSRFGVFWMGRKAIEAATDRTEAINSLSLTLERGASEKDVIRQLDRLLEPYGGTGAYGRKDHPSHAFLDNELIQLNAMTRVIPPVFLFVATFLVYIVLGRMIRVQREQIGLLKAFGYSDAAIGWHYLKFALVVAGLATLLGTATGFWLGSGMTRMYAEYYHFPFLQYRMSGVVFPLAAAMAFGAAGLGALGSVRGAVRLAPAVAMLPPPPPVYGAGAVDRWGRRVRLTVTGQMILRHVVRWPGRSAITVLGVALSIGLLFATIQFIDSARSMMDSFFYRAQRQDLTVTFIEARNKDVLHELAQLPGVLRVEAARAIPVRLGNGRHWERGAIESSPDNAMLSTRIDRTGREVPVPPSGLMLSRQLANKLDIHAGQQVEVELLGGRRTKLTLPVNAVIDEFVGERAYASPETVAAITREAVPAGAALLRIDPDARNEILIKLKEMPVVLGVSERSAALVQFERMIDENIFTMMGFYIAFASAIAVGVVYNSARILFSERAHELATLRVLGYHRREVANILLGELALLVVLAAPLGCAIGYGLARLMTELFSSDLFRMPFAPARASYGFAVLVVLGASALTAVIVARRIMGLDMVRVLKARE